MTTTKASPPAETQPEEGLIGLFGHTYIEVGNPPTKTIQYQFEIIRRLDGARYVVQYFSFLDGSPTNVGVYAESFLLGEDVKLYATEELWNVAMRKQWQDVVPPRPWLVPDHISPRKITPLTGQGGCG